MFPVALWDEARRPSVSVLDTHRTSHGTKQQIIWLECTQVLFCPRNLHPEAGKWDSFCGKDKMTHRPWHGVTWYLTRSSISLWNTAFRPEKVWGNRDTHLTMNSFQFYIYIKAYKTKQRWNATSILNLQKDKKRGLTLPQFFSAKDPGPGTRSPAEHPYPLCRLFLKQIQSLTRKLENFEPQSLATRSREPLDLRGKSASKIRSRALLLQRRCPSFLVFGLTLTLPSQPVFRCPRLVPLWSWE